jgi:Cation efflux family
MSADCCDHRDLADPHRGNAAYRRAFYGLCSRSTPSCSWSRLARVWRPDRRHCKRMPSIFLATRQTTGSACLWWGWLSAIARWRRSRKAERWAWLWVMGTALWHAAHGTLPSAFTMGAVGFAALAANAASFGLLWAYRGGDANMRSAWICTRNDVLGNLAVLLAAAGVFGTGTGWPDVIVAAIMSSLALQGALIVVRQSLSELRRPLAASA